MLKNIAEKIKTGKEKRQQEAERHESFWQEEQSIRQHGIDDIELLLLGFRTTEPHEPLNGVGEGALKDINDHALYARAMQTLKAEIFSRYRGEKPQDELTPEDLEAYLGQAVLDLTILFDHLDHALFDGTTDEQGKTIMGGTSVHVAIKALNEIAKELVVKKSSKESVD